MLCKKPVHGKHGCGQCLPCRINRRRIWTTRLMLEAELHRDSSFVTLTYSPKYYPKNGSLVKTHLSGWLKRLRNYVAPVALRFFGVGEYGDVSLRPHYHILLFGLPGCQLYGTWGPNGRSKKICPCQPCQLVHRSWMKKGDSIGRISVDRCEPDSISYVCGYTVKKLSKSTDVRLPKGCIPEFSLMSRNPGIGRNAIKRLAAAYAATSNFVALIDGTGDVTSVIGTAKGLMPLGRYLRSYLRKEVGYYEDSQGFELKGDKLVKKEGWKTATPHGTKIVFEEMFRMHQRLVDLKGSEAEALKLEKMQRLFRASSVEARHKINNSERTQI